MSFRSLVAATASTVAVVSAAVLVVLGSAAPASAHDVLASTAPAADTTVSGDLDRVTLTFSEPPLAALASGIVVRVTDPDGAEVGSGTVAVDGSVLSRSADLTSPGAYTVTWRSVSVDGHPISGSFRFTSSGTTVIEPTVPTTTSTSTPTPASGAETITPSAPASALAVVDDFTTTGPGALPWVLGGVAVLAAAGLVAALLVVRKRA